MSDSRGSRFALEVLFLVALAVVLALAELRPVEIGGIMLVGRVIVAALEWAAWREWPVARQPVRQDESEPEPVVEPDPWTHAEELPAAPLDEREPVPEPSREAL